MRRNRGNSIGETIIRNRVWNHKIAGHIVNRASTTVWTNYFCVTVNDIVE